MRSTIVVFFATLVAAAPSRSNIDARTGECYPGQMRCSDPMTLQECTYMETWQTIWDCTAPARCIENRTCSDGDRSTLAARDDPVCVPGQIECADRWTVERCGDGGFWQVTEVCEDPEQCVIDGEGGHCGMPGRRNAS
ncbi:hypothetical protein PG993_011412 [Apiospora rasikravindrae]|uniref:Uncharacterized protein n=1 Tax=Apiospora rasikravindrae TaxID=990691 RepID=A0ABR1SEI5_9PEZI